MFLVVAAFQLSTRITQNYRMPLLTSEYANRWFVSESPEAFIDWERNKVRQFVASNNYTHPINVTLRVQTQSDFYPFIQESVALNYPEADEIVFTLLPKQSYQVAIQYNCTTHHEGLHEIELIVQEQTFKGNPSLQDLLTQTSLRYFKYCSNPSTPMFDYTNLLILFLIYALTTVTSLMCMRKNKQQYELTPTNQVIALMVIPIVGSYFYYPEITQQIISFVVLFDFINYKFVSKIICFLGALPIPIMHYFLRDPYSPYIVTIILIIQVNRRIIIANRKQLFVFFCIIWVTEIYWLMHLAQIDKHLLTQESNVRDQFLKTQFSLFLNKDQSWSFKNIDIHLYQLLALSLIQSFIFRHGLFNKQHLVNIISVATAQIAGLIVFDILYRNKHNPPFLTLITGFILLGIAFNYARNGTGLKNPFIEFESIDEKTKL